MAVQPVYPSYDPRQQQSLGAPPVKRPEDDLPPGSLASAMGAPPAPPVQTAGAGAYTPNISGGAPPPMATAAPPPAVITDANGNPIGPGGQTVAATRPNVPEGYIPGPNQGNPNDPHDYRQGGGGTRNDAGVLPSDFQAGVNPGTGAYLPGAGEQHWSTDPSYFTYVNRTNFALPGYDQMNQSLSGLMGDRATPQLGPAAMSGQSDYLTQGQQGLLGAYQGANEFRAGQTGLAGTLGGYAGAGLDASGYAGDVRGLVGNLQGMASGQDSLARQQVQADTQAAIARQRSMAAGARPGQGALAQFGAAKNIAGLELEGASRAAREGLAERNAATQSLAGVLGTQTGQDLTRAQSERQLQLGATGQLADLYGQGRTQDLAGLGAQAGLYGQMAGQEGQYNLANQNAQNQFQLQQMEADLRSRGMDDARIQQALATQLQLNQLAQQGGMGYEQARGQHLAALIGQGDTSKGPLDYIAGIAPAALAAIAKISDERVKTNIAPIPDALEIIASLRGVTWAWNQRAAAEGKTPGTTDAGVIAQEVEAVLPELVVTNEQGHKLVNYAGLIGPLIQAIKELHARVVELEAKK